MRTFSRFWKKKHPQLIVYKSSEDICSICYNFKLRNRYSKEEEDDDDNDYSDEGDDEEEEDDDDDSDDEEEDDEEDNEPGLEDSDDDCHEDKEGECGFTAEEQICVEQVAQLSRHQVEAQSMRLLLQLLTAEVKNVQ